MERMSTGLNNLAAKLTWFSLRRPIAVFMLFVTIVVVGFIAALGIPMELFPRGYESPFLYVFVPWQNAPTQEVMESSPPIRRTRSRMLINPIPG